MWSMKMNTSEIIICYLSIINIFCNCRQKEDSYSNRVQGYLKSPGNVNGEDEFGDTVSGDTEVPLTHPAQCLYLRVGNYVVLKGRPCMIVELSSSATDKHGHVEIHMVGVDVFTGKKYEEICLSTHSIDVPLVTRTVYLVVEILDGYLILQDDKGKARSDFKVPEGKLGESIQEAMDDIDNALVEVIVMKTMGQEARVDLKVDKER